MKYMVTGPAGHGKDTVCELLRLSYKSSSIAALELFLFDILAPKYGYTTIEEAYLDRDNHRQEWYEAIQWYNRFDLTRLARDILATSDIYCGQRDRRELQACKEAGLFDLVIWVDGSERKPPEPSTSLTITPEDADVVLLNNGTEAELEIKVARLRRSLLREAA